jgi:hypothetical protein
MPREEKNRTGVWVLATNRRVTKSSSLVCHARPALAAAALRPVGRQRHPLDVAAMGHGHDHIFRCDQIFIVDLTQVIGNLGAARRAEFAPSPRSTRPDDVLIRARDRRISR